MKMKITENKNQQRKKGQKKEKGESGTKSVYVHKFKASF